jgi:hypothetical protein
MSSSGFISFEGLTQANERLPEVAGILACGLLRLHARGAMTADAWRSPLSANSGLSCLEVSPETVLSGPHGLTVTEVSN